MSLFQLVRIARIGFLLSDDPMSAHRPIPQRTMDRLKTPSKVSVQDRKMAEIAPPIDPQLVLAELNACEILVDSTPDKPERGFLVYRAVGTDIPNLLMELGRLREETFRTVGEGTGLARDNDEYDLNYDHFIAWDKKAREITGAYRIGRVDEIMKAKGKAGVYTTTLFNMNPLLDGDFSKGTLEAGRSFVRPEFQRGLTLLMIWMAIARFIVKHPQYKYLMGPVSISNEFHENSKYLIVNYLMKNHPHEKANTVSGKNPPQFSSNLSPEELTELVDSSLNLNSLQEFVRHAEDNPKVQIPQLIKLYIELGVKFLAFHKDNDFNSIDGLIWLDIPKVPDAIMSRYMSAEELAHYRSLHA